MKLIMKYYVVFSPVKGGFSTIGISRKILDIINTWHDSQKKSGYYRRIYRKFRDIILYKVDIQKVSVFYPVQGEYPESFRIINSYACTHWD
jgi:hypothetical protein